MANNEEIRFEVHRRLLAVDAANIELMKFVSRDLVGTDQWFDSFGIFCERVAGLKTYLADLGNLKAK